MRALPLVAIGQAVVIGVLLLRQAPMPPSQARTSAGPVVASLTPGSAPSRPALSTDGAANADLRAAAGLATLVRSPQADVSPSPSDPIGIVVYGRIVDETGADISWAPVEFQDPAGTSYSGAAKGDWYVVYGLHPGAWSITVTAGGFRPFKADIVLSDAGHRFRYDVVLSRSTIVFVKFETPEGEDLHAALWGRIETSEWDVLTALATPFPPSSGSIGDLRSIGSFVHADDLRSSGIDAPDLCEWSLDVDRPPPFSVCAAFGGSILATREVHASLEVVVFKIAVETIESKLGGARLRVVDSASGLPIGNAAVVMDSRRWGKPVESQADGRVALGNRLPGVQCLEISATGYEAYQRWLFVEPGELLDLGDVRLDPATTIKGRLVGPDGAPVVGRIRCFRLDRESLPRAERSLGSETRADGSFEWSRLGRGSYLIQGESETHAITSIVIDTRGGDVLDAVVRLARGAQVTFDLELGAGELGIELRDSVGHLVQLEDAIGSGPTCLRAILAPGAYTLTIRNGREVTHSEQVTVGTIPLRVRASG